MRYPVDFPDLLIRRNLLFLHLKTNQLTLEGYIADVMSVLHLDNPRFAGDKGRLIFVAEEVFASVLETNFNNTKAVFRRQVHLGQPVDDVRFVATACETSAVVLGSRHF